MASKIPQATSAASPGVESRTIDVVVDTSALEGETRQLILKSVPTPISFEYLAKRLEANGCPAPKNFITRSQIVSADVTEEKSSLDLGLMAGSVNADEPLCRYYYRYFLQSTAATEARNPNIRNQPFGDVNTARFGWRDDLIHVGGVNISFMRTVRVPDDRRTYSIPTSLGKFPLFNAATLANRLPQSIVSKGGVLMGMHQCEAMWMDFKALGNSPAYAVKVSASGLNALTGLPRNATAVGRQDYLAVRQDSCGQQWLDGFSTEEGLFVAEPLEEQFGVDSQPTRQEDIGSIQIDVFPLYEKPSRFYTDDGRVLDPYKSARQQGVQLGQQVKFVDPQSVNNFLAEDASNSTYIQSPVWYLQSLHLCARPDTFVYVKMLTGRTITLFSKLSSAVDELKRAIRVEENFTPDEQRLVFAGKQLNDSGRLVDHDVRNGSTLYLILRLNGGERAEPPGARSQSFVAGGQITQQIILDPLPSTAYNFDKGTRLHITILDPISLAQLTGKPPISTPINILTYISAKLSWFEFYDEGIPMANDFSGGRGLADEKSLQMLLSERRDKGPSRCSYCSNTASYVTQPCGVRLCEGCAHGLPADECLKRFPVSSQRERMFGSNILEGNRANVDCPTFGIKGDPVVDLTRCVERGLVGTFRRASDDVSELSSAAPQVKDGSK